MDTEIRSAERNGEHLTAARLKLRAGELFHRLSLDERRAYIQAMLDEHPLGKEFDIVDSREHRNVLYIAPIGQPQSVYKFTTHSTDLRLERLEIVKRALEGPRSKIHYQVCCPVAERSFCVCIISWKCALHGGGCYGTHD